jgi:hypothetical protein
MLFFVIPVGIFVIAMLAFAFWPRKRNVVDINDLEHPPKPPRDGSG